MADKTGTYVSFFVEGIADSSQSDMEYYSQLLEWYQNQRQEFHLIGGHDKVAAGFDSALRDKLNVRMIENLNQSKNLLLLLGERTKLDTDWVPVEIAYAVDTCQIPIIAAYTQIEGRITNPEDLEQWWPPAFKQRFDDNTVKAIHVPFQEAPVKYALDLYSNLHMPNWADTCFNEASYNNWAIY
ncbi:MAG: hypothetical protein ISR48_11875 [Alphaproteobacteria bacterium]|nr:hypothetical protein [Alphaproteobacteria bacterium]